MRAPATGTTGVRLSERFTASAARPDICHFFIHLLICFLVLNMYAYVYVYICMYMYMYMCVRMYMYVLIICIFNRFGGNIGTKANS